MVATVPYVSHGLAEFQGVGLYKDGVSQSRRTANYWGGRLNDVFEGFDEYIKAIAKINLDVPHPPAAPSVPYLPPPGIDIDTGTLPAMPEPPTEGNFVPPPVITIPQPDLPPLPDCEMEDVNPNFPRPPEPPRMPAPIPVPKIPDFESDVALITVPPPGDLTIPLEPSGSCPAANLPTPPDFSDISVDIPAVPPPNLPDQPTTKIPEWEAGEPIDIPVPPPVLPGGLIPDEFNSWLFDALAESVLEMLATAQLDQEYERASFDAVMQREVEASANVLSKVPSLWAGRGFYMPPGTMLEMDLDVRREIELKAKAGSREIFVERKKQELQVRQAALQAGTQLVSVEAQVYQIVQQVVLDYQKFSEGQVIKLFELTLLAAQVSKEILLAQVAAYRARIDAIIAEWDAYEAAIKGDSAKYGAITAQIQAVTAQLGVAQAEAQVYSTLVSAETAVAKMGLDYTQAQFANWRVKVDVEIAEFNSYSIYGDILKAQASAIDAEARAFEAEVKGEIAKTEGAATAAKLDLEVSQIVVNIYDSTVKAEAARVDALTRLNMARSALYNDIAQYAIARAQAISGTYQAEAQVNATRMQAAATAYASMANAKGAYYNSYSGLFNAHSSRLNALRAEVDAEVAFYRAQLDAVIIAYRSESEFSDRSYARTLATWTTAVNRELAGIEGGMQKLSSLAEYPSRVAQAAMSQAVVSMQSHEQKQIGVMANYQYQLQNSLAESYRAEA